MDANEFNLGLLADPIWTADGMTRVRYIVAEAISVQAQKRQKEGRPDKAGLLRWIASQINAGRTPTKKAMKKAASDIKVVEALIVDNVPIGKSPSLFEKLS